MRLSSLQYFQSHFLHVLKGHGITDAPSFFADSSQIDYLRKKMISPTVLVGKMTACVEAPRGFRELFPKLFAVGMEPGTQEFEKICHRFSDVLILNQKMESTSEDSLVSYFKHFFREDLSLEVVQEILLDLFLDDALLGALLTDVRHFFNKTPDYQQNLVEHIEKVHLNYLTPYGIPALDLGIYFWRGEDFSVLRKTFLKWFRTQGYSKGDEYYEIFHRMLDFAGCLESLSHGFSVPQLIDLNPLPTQAILEMAESRFSFFRFVLPFLHEGKDLSPANEQRMRFLVRFLEWKFENLKCHDDELSLPSPRQIQGAEWSEENKIVERLRLNYR